MSERIDFTCPYCNAQFYRVFENDEHLDISECDDKENEIYCCKHGFLEKSLNELFKKCKPCMIQYISERL